MRKISQAIDEFDDYVQKKVDENQRVSGVISDEVFLNDREKQLIFYFISEDRASVTAVSHSTTNNISRQTATKDLKNLESLDLIKPGEKENLLGTMLLTS